MHAILMAKRMPSRQREATSVSSQSCKPTLNAARKGVHASWRNKVSKTVTAHTVQYTVGLCESRRTVNDLEHGPDMLQMRRTGERSLNVADGLHQSLGRFGHLLHLHIVQQAPLLLTGYT